MKNKNKLVQIVFCLVLVLGLILTASVVGAGSRSAQVTDECSIIYLPADSPSTVSATTLNMTNGIATPMVVADHCHTVGLKSNGTVVSVGSNVIGEANVGGWTGIVQVAAGYWFTVGLKSDGSLVATGDNSYGQCDVDDWADLVIVQIATGEFHTVGLKSDGTVVAIGNNFYGQRNVDTWTGIVQVAAGGYYHTVGLKSNGQVVAVGWNDYHECDVGNWTGITQVAAGYFHTVGLMSNGTVVAVGDNSQHQCNVGKWQNITQVSAGYDHTVGLKSDGTVVARGDDSYGQLDVDTWTGIVQVSAGYKYTVGLKSNGTVVWTGDNGCGECNLCPMYHWNLSGGPVPNRQPNTASNPSPANNATGVLTNTCLSWSGGDPDGDPVTYDVYFGTSSSPPLVSNDQSGTTYCPGALAGNTKYYWKIIANDNYGGSTTGPLWNFTTQEQPNKKPYTPGNPSPANYATGVDVNVDLSWDGGDPDAGDTVTYDVYFGTNSTPPLVSNDQLTTTHDPGTLSYNTMYYWKIVATDNHGASSEGPVWNFKTSSTPNNPPYTPGNPSPANYATGVDINVDLSWAGGDPDAGDTVTYDIYLGANATPLLLSSDQLATAYNPGALIYSTKYYWKIVATDNHGASTEGPIWDFTTINAAQCEPSPEVAFDNLVDAGQLLIAYNFDPFTTVPTAVNGWTWYDPTLPPSQNNLANLKKNTPYWIKVTVECWLTYGTWNQPHLAAGWNNIVWGGC